MRAAKFRRACASAQSRQNLRCSLIQTVIQEEPSDRKPDPWPFWMAGHAQLKFVRDTNSLDAAQLSWRLLVKQTNQKRGRIIWAPLSENVSSKVCDRVIFKPACSATETSKNLEVSDLETRDIILSTERTTKVLTRLRGCAGWSAPLLFAYGIRHIFAWPGSIIGCIVESTSSASSHGT